MTEEPFDYAAFEATRRQLIDTIHNGLEDNDRRFLLSFKEGAPAWVGGGFEDLETFPAVQWKLQNIRRLKENNPLKRRDQWEALKKALHPEP